MVKDLLCKLAQEHSLSHSEYLCLIEGFNGENAKFAAQLALEERRRKYGNEVFIRGLIEISNICKNDCLYCGIRASNNECDRYRLSQEEILDCCDDGYRLGFRTFVLQGGEDGYFTNRRLCDLIKQIKAKYPDCAVTLSVGERSLESYIALKQAGADRYLLRHETADCEHYRSLHPQNLRWENRMECLKNLKTLGFQVGCGFMVGSPYQTSDMLAKELKFIEDFKPDMCGIGPFIPHSKTPFKDFSAGSVDMTCYLLSLIRLIHPNVLLPATTALGTLSNDGREKGILSGANVVMPNLSPKNVRKKYMLYNNKLSDGDEAAEALNSLKERIKNIGFEITVSLGDVRKEL